MNRADSTQDNPDYLEFYSLDCAPFSENPGQRFLYTGNAHIQRLDLLQHLTQFGGALVLVTGPDGSGKTTLFRQFTDSAKHEWTVCATSAAEGLDLHQLLADQLEGQAGTPIKRLITDWINSHEDTHLLVLAIDDAEQLDRDTLQQLAVCFEDPLAERVRLVLFGTPSTRQLITRAQQDGLFKASTQFLDIPRLTEEETATYLMFRLAMAGYSGENPFTATEVRAICKTSEGRLLDTNRLAHACLEDRYERALAREKSGVKLETRRIAFNPWYLAAGLVIAGIFSWVFLALQSEDQPAQTLKVEALPVPALPATVDAEQTRPASPASGAVVADITPGGAETGAQSDQTRDGHNTGAGEPASGTTPSPEATQPATAVTPAPSPATPPPGQPELTPPVTASQPAATKPVVEKPVSTAPGLAQDDALSHRESWLMQQPAGHHTLQLLGSRSEKSVRRFIRQHKLPAGKTAYYRGRYKGGDWYVVVYGVYPSRADASQHIRELPESIRKASPWPRPIQSIQKAIEAVSAAGAG